MGKLDGKTALITGGTSGIGAAMAELFAEEGASVIIVGRNSERGEQKAEEINRHYNIPRCRFFSCDVTSSRDIRNLHHAVCEAYGRLDILVNNAGVLITKNLQEMTDEDIDQIYHSNYKSVVDMTRIFMPLIESCKGVVLNIASSAGMQSHIEGARSYLYASSKAGVIQFTRLCALNYANKGVRINCLCPGIVNTPIYTNRDFSRFKNIPLGRIADAKEIAKAALFLVSEDASYITGVILPVDGGKSIT